MKWVGEIDGEFNGNPCKIRVGVSETYSESAILKLTKMVLNINENNTVDFDINGDVCIGSGYLLQMKDLAREIIGDYDDNKE
jgi:hypothetical protein